MFLSAPPPSLDLSASRVSEIQGVLLSTWILAAIAVVLRVVARRLKGNPLWIEDYLVFISLTAAASHVFVSIAYMVPRGTGRHVWAASPDGSKAWALGLFISEVVYTITLATVKWSTLAFYWRIFSANNSIKLPIQIMAGIVAAWAIAVLLVTFLQCQPLNSFWMRYDPMSPASPDDFTCAVDLNAFFNGNSIPNIITDGFVVLLPVPYVLKLQLSTVHKLAICGIFILGIFVTIISVVRLVNILNVDLASPDVTWNFVGAIIWTNTEANCAVIACCLPSLRPILNLALRGTIKSTIRTEEEGKLGGTAARNGQWRKSTSRLTHASYGTSETNTANLKKTLRMDNERPFSRLEDGESSSYNDDSGSNHELTNLAHGGDGMITESSRLDSSVKMPGGVL